MLNIDNKFDIGQTVYLKTDREQSPRIVVCLIVGKYDILYEMISGLQTSRHFDFEISEEVSVIF